MDRYSLDILARDILEHSRGGQIISKGDQGYMNTLNNIKRMISSYTEKVVLEKVNISAQENLTMKGGCSIVISNGGNKE